MNGAGIEPASLIGAPHGNFIHENITARIPDSSGIGFVYALKENLLKLQAHKRGLSSHLSFADGILKFEN